VRAQLDFAVSAIADAAVVHEAAGNIHLHLAELELGHVRTHTALVEAVVAERGHFRTDEDPGAEEVIAYLGGDEIGIERRRVFALLVDEGPRRRFDPAVSADLGAHPRPLHRIGWIGHREMLVLDVYAGENVG